MRYNLYDDYSEGAHPDLISHLRAGNVGQQRGYGEDTASAAAAERIRTRFGVDADVHFVSGATQANLIVLSAMLESYQGVIAPATGHIATHETGAIEATGHKVLTVDTPDGRLTPAMLDTAMATHSSEHTVQPGAVFLTQATEVGTVYSRQMMAEVVAHATKRGLPVFADGARLSMALSSPAAGMTPEDFGALGLAAFTIGGTKVGGMFGDAIVLIDEKLRQNFRYRLKQRGALLAKGRFLGLQFERFFDEDDLWLRMGQLSNDNAHHLTEGLAAAGVKLAQEQQTNQVFAILPDAVIAELQESYGFHVWRHHGISESVVRLVTSWATPESVLERFVADVLQASA